MFRMTAGAIILTWPAWAFALSFGPVPPTIAWVGVFGACLLMGVILDCTKPAIPRQ